MRIVDAHNHVIWPFNEPVWREPELLDARRLIDSSLPISLAVK